MLKKQCAIILKFIGLFNSLIKFKHDLIFIFFNKLFVSGTGFLMIDLFETLLLELIRSIIGLAIPDFLTQFLKSITLSSAILSLRRYKNNLYRAHLSASVVMGKSIIFKYLLYSFNDHLVVNVYACQDTKKPIHKAHIFVPIIE